jgi:HEAT repeat protein
MTTAVLRRASQPLARPPRPARLTSEAGELVASLQSADPRERHRAARALGELRDPATIGPLAAAGVREPGNQGVVWALTQFKDRRLISPLVLALGAPSETVRWLAAGKLGDLAAGAAVRPLVAVLEQDEADSLREQAARSLGLIGDLAALGPLMDALADDPAPQVREEAAGALGRLRDGRARPALEDAVSDGHVAVRRVATGALRAL